MHPWDVMHEGAAQVLETISDLGVSRINLATSYHAGRYILPRDPKQRVFHAEEGVVYFKPDMGYFAKSVLKPIRSSRFADVDVVEVVTRESKNYNLGVNSWTVTLHNSNFARSHPELAVVDAFGDIDQNFICPSHEETIEYVKGLVQNLAEQYRPERNPARVNRVPLVPEAQRSARDIRIPAGAARFRIDHNMLLRQVYRD